MTKILEIPPQVKEIPKDVLKYADEADIKIREISGKALEEFKKIEHLFY